MKSIIEWIVSIIVSIVIVVAINTFIIQSHQVSGESMSPTFKDGDRVIVQKLLYGEKHIQRGDVIVFQATKEKRYIKRVIATPGDTMRYEHDQLFVNGKKVSEPYLDANKKKKDAETNMIQNIPLTEDITVAEMTNSNGSKTVPKGMMVVMGDNRQNSTDSRDPRLGLVHEDKIVGKVVFRYYPFSTFKYDFDTH